MTTRGGRGRWQRVLDAREQTRLALGREPGEADLYGPPRARAPQAKALSRNPAPLHPSERAEIVLTISQAAQQLGVERDELEALIAAGKVRVMPTEFVLMVPTSEIEKLKARRNRALAE